MKVSIVTVCFNSNQFIKDAIESVLLQDYLDIEFIIVDGGSTDGTIEIIESYKSRISKIICEPDDGIYDAMNKGISVATGEIVGLLNSDDYYSDNTVISDVVNVFQSSPNIDVLLGNVEFFKQSKSNSSIRLYSSFKFEPWKLRFGLMPAHPSSFIRNSAYKQVGLYKLNYQIAGDFDWFVRAFLINSVSFSKINRTMVRMRIGGVSTSGITSYWISSKEQLRALKEYDIQSNIIFVMLRLPIKFLYKLFRRSC